ncbi:hypothetical protein [Saccharopolyspora spinosa]|uniref:hypothetical protein n=1 Tax=Saccharopolyspora spinosa TaxID=60894 RepID=UPI000237B6AF|nr:hypothetical protein [Saccharopolyspora spinosa]
MEFAAGSGVVVDRGGPVAAVAAVVGEGHQSLAGAAVDRVPEGNGVVFAGLFGDRDGAGLGGELRAATGAFDMGPISPMIWPRLMVPMLGSSASSGA